MSKNVALTDVDGTQVLPITTSENVYVGAGVTLKEHLQNLADNVPGGTVIVDKELSETSENPVQNKVVTEKLNKISAKVYIGTGSYNEDTNCINLNISDYTYYSLGTIFVGIFSKTITLENNTSFSVNDTSIGEPNSLEPRVIDANTAVIFAMVGVSGVPRVVYAEQSIFDAISTLESETETAISNVKTTATTALNNTIDLTRLINRKVYYGVATYDSAQSVIDLTIPEYTSYDTGTLFFGDFENDIELTKSTAFFVNGHSIGEPGSLSARQISAGLVAFVVKTVSGVPRVVFLDDFTRAEYVEQKLIEHDIKCENISHKIDELVANDIPTLTALTTEDVAVTWEPGIIIAGKPQTDAKYARSDRFLYCKKGTRIVCAPSNSPYIAVAYFYHEADYSTYMNKNITINNTLAKELIYTVDTDCYIRIRRARQDSAVLTEDEVYDWNCISIKRNNASSDNADTHSIVKANTLKESTDNVCTFGLNHELAYLKNEGYTSQDGTPTPTGPIEVVGCGVDNLLKPISRTLEESGVTCTPNGDGSYTLNGTATAQIYFVLGNGSEEYVEIIKTKQLKILGGTSKVAVMVSKWASDWSQIPTVADRGSGAISYANTNVKYGRINLGITKDTVLNNEVVKPMLTTNLTATADDFVPFTDGKYIAPIILSDENNTNSVRANIPLDDPLYEGDYIEVYEDGSGEIVRTMREYIVDDATAWTSEPIKDTSKIRFTCTALTTNAKSFSNNAKCSAKCNRYVASTADATYLGSTDNIFAINVNGYLHIYSSEFATLEDFKTHISSKPLKFVYELKTPTRTALTPLQVAEFKKLTTFEGTTHINADGTVAVRYYADKVGMLEKEIEELKTTLASLVVTNTEE